MRISVTRAIALTAVLAAFISAVYHIAEAQQYYPGSAVVNTYFEAGTLIPANGGTGAAIGCGAPTTTCGPCQIPGTYYWNADVNVVLDGGSPFTWTDVCTGVITAPITTSPTYTANCVGTHHCMTYTKSTAMAMNQPDAAGTAGFPAISTPYTYGVLFAGVGSLTTNTYMLDFGPTQGLVGVLHNISGVLTCNNSTGINAPAAGYLNTELVLLLCREVNSTLTNVGSAFALTGGVSTGSASTVGTHNPGGGITIGNVFNGQDASGAADGKILSVVVFTHDLTKLEEATYTSWEQTYWGAL